MNVMLHGKREFMLQIELRLSADFKNKEIIVHYLGQPNVIKVSFKVEEGSTSGKCRSESDRFEEAVILALKME